jgi:hypothetical protein
MMHKRKADKSDSIKMKSLHFAKDYVKRIKRQATGWEKIFANHIPNKGVVLKNI